MNIQPKVCGLSQFFDTCKSVLSYFKVCEVMGCGTSKEEMSATMDPPATSCHQKIVRLVIPMCLRGHTPNLSNPNDFIGRLVTL